MATEPRRWSLMALTMVITTMVLSGCGGGGSSAAGTGATGGTGGTGGTTGSGGTSGTAGINWSLRPPLTWSLITGIEYLNNKWFLMSPPPNGSIVVIADTTPTSTSTAQTPIGSIRGIAYGNGVYVAVSQGGIATSPDNVLWTARVPANGGANQWFSNVAFGNGRFVIVTTYSTNPVQTSVDGITWTTVSSPAFPTPVAYSYQLYHVTFVNGQFIAFGQDENGSTAIYTSPDGLTWTKGTITGLAGAQPPHLINAATFGGGKYVAVGRAGLMFTSADGVTWTIQPSATPNDLSAVAYGNGKFAAVGVAGTIVTSADGMTWTALPALTTTDLTDIIYTGFEFDAVGANVGGGSTLITSP